MSGQLRTINGTVVDEFDLTPLTGVNIYNGNILLGATDTRRNFSIQLPQGTDELHFVFIGLERTIIKIPPDCRNVEVVMIADGTTDFMTLKKENRIRYKRFKRLARMHRKAYDKGSFNSTQPCFSYQFQKH